jgi:hypothetical protein
MLAAPMASHRCTSTRPDAADATDRVRQATLGVVDRHVRSPNQRPSGAAEVMHRPTGDAGRVVKTLHQVCEVGNRPGAGGRHENVLALTARQDR